MGSCFGRVWGGFGESFGRLFGDFGRPFGAVGRSLGGPQMGREYSHWTDLTLISPLEAVISKHLSHQNQMFVKPMFLTSRQMSKKVQKDPAAPTPIV